MNAATLLRDPQTDLVRSFAVLIRRGGIEFAVRLPNSMRAQAETLSKRIPDNVCALPFPDEPTLTQIEEPTMQTQ